MTPMRRVIPLAALVAATMSGVGLTSGPAGAAAGAAPPPGARDVTAIERAEAAAAPSRSTATGGRPSVTPRALTSTTPLPDGYPVGTLGDTYVDTARGTPAYFWAPAHANRYLPTTIWYPAAAGGKGYDQGRVAPAAGRFPLLVFAHGYNANPATYRPFLHTLAAAGYVVAAPTFPTSHYINGVMMPPRSTAEMVNQAYDMSAVIGGVQWRVAHDPWLLRGTVDTGRIGVIGHSDGAMTVAGMQLSTGYYDSRPKVTVVMSGAGLAMPGGSYGVRRTTPLLVEQATQDPYNGYANGLGLFNGALGRPKTMLSVSGPYHIWPLIGDDPVADLTRRATLDFLNWQLKGWWLSPFALANDGGVPGYTAQRTVV